MLRRQVGTIHLRAVPPVSDRVAIGRGTPFVLWPALMVRASSQDRHLFLRPVVAFGHGKTPRRALRVIDAMAEPIVNHELQPCRQQDIDRVCRYEGAARQQFAADDARIGFIEAWRLFAVGLRQGRVASKAGTGHAHPGLRQIVERAVHGAAMANVKIAWWRRIGGRSLGVEQVAPPQIDPQR